jgi:lysophospholipase L1-like esterase
MADYLRNIIDFFVHPNPGNGFELLLLGIVYLSIAGYVFFVLRATWRLLKFTFFETFVASYTHPFAAPHPTGEKRILILGDSTAVGAGASAPEDTIAGRLAHDFPKADIVNLGINGSRTKDVLRALKAVADQRFELVIASVGGNDIWHFGSLLKLERNLHALLQAAKAVASGPVILLLYNNIGSSPIFPSFMRQPLKRRGVLIQELFRSVAGKENVPCIELFSNDEDNPFLHEPNRFFSPDGVHPSSEGYRLWYHRMWRLLVARGYKF